MLISPIYTGHVLKFVTTDKTMSLMKFYLCCSDKQTKMRHIQKYHANTDAEKGQVRFVDTNATEAKEAFKSYKMASLACNTKTAKGGQKCDEVTIHESAGAGSLPPEDEISTENLLTSAHKKQSTETSQLPDATDRLESKVDT